jgi:hypothetical protein
MIVLPLVTYSAYLSYTRIAHPAGPWYDRSALLVALLLGLPFAILLAHSLGSRIFGGVLYLIVGGVVLVVYAFVFVGVVFDSWL